MPPKIHSFLDVIREIDMFEPNHQGKSRNNHNCEPVVIIGRGDGPVSYSDVHQEWVIRRNRRDHLPASLFAEPAWDMLLHLYATELSGGRSTVTRVIQASNAPVATAIRWIGHLINFGLCRKVADDQDRRRQFVSLTPNGIEAMREYFSDIRSNHSERRAPADLVNDDG
jgi:predicted transcriptional regulator